MFVSHSDIDGPEEAAQKQRLFYLQYFFTLRLRDMSHLHFFFSEILFSDDALFHQDYLQPTDLVTRYNHIIIILDLNERAWFKSFMEQRCNHKTSNKAVLLF